MKESGHSLFMFMEFAINDLFNCELPLFEELKGRQEGFFKIGEIFPERFMSVIEPIIKSQKSTNNEEQYSVVEN